MLWSAAAGADDGFSQGGAFGAAYEMMAAAASAMRPEARQRKGINAIKVVRLYLL